MTNFAPPEDPEGSSPLTRGKPSARASSSTTWRLIPAHAGKTCRLCGLRILGGAHPRSRGENPALVTMDEIWKGSSPLTRGKPCRRRISRPVGGLIPAHAGKTRKTPKQCKQWAAHPRSRGENQVKGHLRVVLAGSSPLTRGKLIRVLLRTSGQRLIPAHAGKTTVPAFVLSMSQAHPRSRGENTSMASSVPISLGSSPLTRGKRAQIKAAVSVVGLIPAHAGKTR